MTVATTAIQRSERDRDTPPDRPTARHPAGRRRGHRRTRRPVRRGPPGCGPWLVAGGVVAVLVALVAGVAFGPVSLPPGQRRARTAQPASRAYASTAGSPSARSPSSPSCGCPGSCSGCWSAACSPWPAAATRGCSATRSPTRTCWAWRPGAGLGVTAADRPRRRGGAALRRAAADHRRWRRSRVRSARSALTYLLGAAGGRDRSPATLILAGVAVSAFLSAGADVPAAAQRPTTSGRSTPGCSAGWPPPAGTTCCWCCRTRCSRRWWCCCTAASWTCSPSATTRRPASGLQPAAHPLPADRRRVARHRRGGLRLRPDRLRRHHRAAHGPAARRRRATG